MKALKITLALAVLFIVITSFTKKDENTNLQSPKPKQVFYSNGIAQD